MKQLLSKNTALKRNFPKFSISLYKLFPRNQTNSTECVVKKKKQKNKKTHTIFNSDVTEKSSR